MKKLMLAIFAGGMLMVSSCSKTGPTGPQGPTGNANVIGESPFTVSTWNFSTPIYSATFTDANITADVASNGLVEIYMLYSSSGGNSWTNLPFIDGVEQTVYNFGTGGFSISILTTDGSVPNPPGSQTFRVVVVPSSVRKANPNTNWKNYYETMAVMNKVSASSVSASN